jgi:hypothetical protein
MFGNGYAVHHNLSRVDYRHMRDGESLEAEQALKWNRDHWKGLVSYSNKLLGVFN